MDLSRESKQIVMSDMLDIANSYGIRMTPCSQPELDDFENENGVSMCPGGCIVGPEITRQIGERVPHTKDKGQRDSCRCTVSRDIGSYELVCSHQCVYCYANPVV